MWDTVGMWYLQQDRNDRNVYCSCRQNETGKESGKT